MAFLDLIIVFISFLCSGYSLETDLISGETYRLTEDSLTWLEAKSRCSLASKFIAELDESTGRVKSAANISGSESFTAWIDAYKIHPHVLLNKGCYNLQEEDFYLLNGTNEPRTCAVTCPDVAHIALQENRCYCLTAASVSKENIDLCNSSCPGDRSKTCGNTNLTTLVSVYEVVKMSEDMCPCVMTESNNGGVEKFEIIPYIVNCTYINLHYLCKPQNDKDFNNDVFNVYKNVYKANSSCTFGLAEFYHVEYNFEKRNPQFNLGPSYYINFIRGLTSVVGGVVIPDNPSKCYAYSHDESAVDSIVERSCSESIAGLCQYDETTTASIPTTIESTTTRHYINSTDKEFTLLPIINEGNNTSIAVLIIVIAFVLSLGLIIKCMCNVISIVKGRRADHQHIDQSSRNKTLQNTTTEQKGVPIYASVCKINKPAGIEHTNLAFDQESKEFQPYEIGSSYNKLIRDDKQSTTENNEGLYDSTADDIYNALSWTPPCAKSVDEDTYDHTISISPVSNSSGKPMTPNGSKSHHSETKQHNGKDSKFTDYNHLELDITKQEDGLYDHTIDGTNRKEENSLYDHTSDGTHTKQEDSLYDHTSDGTYNILSLSYKSPSQTPDNIYDHMTTDETR